MMLPKKSESELSAHLDPNHSHFILVDSTKLNEFGGEIKFRSRLESAISKRNLSEDSQVESNINANTNTNIPIVVIVLGGGRNTVAQVLSSVENKIPCIIFDARVLYSFKPFKKNSNNFIDFCFNKYREQENFQTC
jgi:hypothetical protein